ncbi:hypothetical protein TPY_0816 [Sulfobacillus acidophilus TPY]|uniref:Uncharacterized protein n=1 Tax=Sulfobacillus acidophilus (strain ATCC 700253 / DSM 10332 / NAL) TaxID=679936 RepID=G8TZ16_SULAD|nr:hypothetical protein TPY_0816 [Sulfobacillus acidophilus TPY]AEW06286.1 hypothetical protein Sulac_2825 [Sulfobacillus acidophilus DSM 10332]
MKYIGWLLPIGFLVWLGASANAAMVAPLTSAFKATGAHATGYSLNGWVEVTGNPGLDHLVKDVADVGHISGAPVSQSGTTYDKVTVSQQTAGVTTRIIAESLTAGGTYIVIDRTSTDGLAGLYDSQNWLTHLLAPYGTVHLSVNLVGWVSQSYSPAMAKGLINQAFAAVGANPVNAMTTAEYVSVAGETPAIGTSDTLAGRPVNIQVAVTPNTYWGHPEVLVGSPLITMTY